MDPADRPPPAADTRALGALEFSGVLHLVAGFAGTPVGAAHVRALVPRRVQGAEFRVQGLSARVSGREFILGEHARVAAMRRILATDEGWPSPPIPELSDALTQLAVPGSIWSGRQLRDLVTLLTGSRAIVAALSRCAARGVDVQALVSLRNALGNDAKLEGALDKVVDDEGLVRDGASPELKRIRRRLRGAEGELVKLLERLMSKIEPHHRVDDASVTMRNGRWVIPVRREGRGSIGGIVHDSSASGATVFVEPPAAVEAANGIRELATAELAEVQRVLADTTEAIRPKSRELASCLDAMIELDSLAARGRFADHYRCAPATLGSPAEGLKVVIGRHPLLLAKEPAKVVPFDLFLAPAERTLLVSGPNTGGKTVLLKAIALLSLMVQAGIPATVGPESVLPLYDRVFADIGDEQSIEASLSTFSGHVKNLVEIAEAATADSLVLADELGSGTDPTEGAALGAAILETLTRRGTTSVATTHLGALKELAHEVPGVVNASLQFDEAALAPTYRLLKGIPGRSYGLSIARRLRMPGAILENAEARVPDSERSAAALIEDLEKRQRALEEREKRHAEREESYAARNDRMAERERKVRTRERELEREGREAGKQYVLEARKEIEKVIAALRKSADDQAVAEARSVAERLLSESRQALRATTESDLADLPDQSDPIQAVVVGDFVEVQGFGTTAKVLEIKGAELVVAMGSLKTTVTAKSARKVSRKHAEPVATLLDQPDIHAKHEIDLRGHRVHEVDQILQQALDDAVRADLPVLRVIHGKATGALRERVGELLRSDPRVRSFRLGAWNEGGAGVTVVEL
jgi:DNA mismatch repair protein MutS2